MLQRFSGPSHYKYVLLLLLLLLSTEKKAPAIRPWELPYLGIIHNGGCQNFDIVKT